MNASRSDRWSALDNPEAVEAAADTLRQIGATASEQLASQRWLSLLAPQPGERVLDVGAGVGDMSIAFAHRIRPDGAVHALDLSAGLLRRARRRARREQVDEIVHTDAADARDLPYDDDGFDAALCRWVLLHLPDPERVVAEMRRVVRPGGRILCVEVDWGTLSVEPGDPDITRRIVQANVERQVDGRIGARLESLARDAGLHAVSVTPVFDLDRTGDWLSFLRSRLTVAADAGVPEGDLATWWNEIESAVPSGEYRFSFTQYGVSGTVPDSE